MSDTLSNLKKIEDIGELREIQVSLLDRVHSFCMENNIRYFLSSGTLIGAVRHKGYIPWDDDIDMYMPRPDYERFIREFPKKYPPNTKILSINTCKDYIYPFAKVADTRTILIEDDFPYHPLSVNIDVFPLYTVPNAMWKRRIAINLVNYLRKKIYIFARAKSAKFSDYNKFSNALMGTLVKYTIPFSNNFISKIIEFVAPSWNEKSIYVNNLTWGVGMRGCFPKTCIEKSIDIEFEGKKYKSMQGYDIYLKTIFGDYMTLPPLEKRVTKHSFDAYWKDGEK